MKYLPTILEIRKQRKVSVVNLSKATGIPEDRIYQWEAGKGNPKAEDSEKLQKWIAEKVQEPETKIAIPGISDQAALVRILDNLSAAHLEIAASNNRLSENEKTILQKLPTENAQREMIVTGQSKLMALQEYVLELLVKTKSYKTREAAEEALNKITGEFQDSFAQMNIHAEQGK